MVNIRMRISGCICAIVSIAKTWSKTNYSCPTCQTLATSPDENSMFDVTAVSLLVMLAPNILLCSGAHRWNSGSFVNWGIDWRSLKRKDFPVVDFFMNCAHELKVPKVCSFADVFTFVCSTDVRVNVIESLSEPNWTANSISSVAF